MSEHSTTYADEVYTIINGFDCELCEECGHDLDRHSIAPDPLGHAHAYCLSTTEGLEAYCLTCDDSRPIELEAGSIADYVCSICDSDALELTDLLDDGQI